MSSGYSSSAIRERIYFGDDMSGVLLYTGSADKEGSLGGLVELGNIDQLIVLMKDAFQEALVCTNDPEYHGQEGNIELGARIHSKELAKQVEDIFTSLVFKRIFVEL